MKIGWLKMGKLFGFRKILLLSLLGLALLSGWGCATGNHLTQTSTIDALLAGVYDGEMSCAELLGHGDFGIGTFDHLDGEMVVLDGTVYQVKIDGRVYQPAKELKTPFASVCFFASDREVTFESGLNYEGLKAMLDEILPNRNLFVAVKIKGLFKRMKVRSVPAQSKPYQPLAQVVKDQKIFELEEVVGTIVGFRSPPFVKGINVPGYHFHFLDQKRQTGGHILELETISGICQLDTLNTFTLVLPSASGSLAGVDLGKDRSYALEKVER
ncbi:MAG: acetolactate decarboxylase [Pseudomonadota bacterium]|nr:acetolactate decarboxylase [Pseudomonadota bacterium]